VKRRQERRGRQRQPCNVGLEREPAGADEGIGKVPAAQEQPEGSLSVHVGGGLEQGDPPAPVRQCGEHLARERAAALADPGKQIEVFAAEAD